MDTGLAALSQAVGAALAAHSARLATAESCTGGWVSQVVTDTAGSSAWFDRGFVTYSNQAKIAMLGVSPATLDRFGAVSPATAQEMAAGAIQNSLADWALAITGIAGPGGGSPDKPVGTVCFSWCQRDAAPDSETRHFAGDRTDIRRQAVAYALQGLLSRLGV